MTQATSTTNCLSSSRLGNKLEKLSTMNIDGYILKFPTRDIALETQSTGSDGGGENGPHKRDSETSKPGLSRRASYCMIS